MVKREDEQAFAELNGAYIKFVEDAARLVYKEFDRDQADQGFPGRLFPPGVAPFSRRGSVICKGVKGGFTADFSDFKSLVC